MEVAFSFLNLQSICEVVQNFLSLGLNPGAQITYGGQVQRPRQGVVEIEFLGEFAERNLYSKHGLHGNKPNSGQPKQHT